LGGKAGLSATPPKYSNGRESFEWTADRDATLRAMRLDGDTMQHIADTLDCSIKIVQHRVDYFRRRGDPAIRPPGGKATAPKCPNVARAVAASAAAKAKRDAAPKWKRKCLRLDCQRAFDADSPFLRLCETHRRAEY
jgi:hypothetical protein